jgi:copper chaperone
MNVHLKNMHMGYSSAYAVAIQVLVFKTNLRWKKDLRQVTPALNNQPGILRWNVDQQDVDCVLRIETNQLLSQDIVQLISNSGYTCEELPD